MKKTIVSASIIIILLALAAIGVFVLRSILNSSLERVIHEYVEPALRKNLHAEVSMGKAQVCILRGSVLLQDARIGNPRGFSEPDCLRVDNCEIKLGLLTLLKGRVDEISAITAQGVELNLQRNAADGLNIIYLLTGSGRLKKATTSKSPDLTPSPPAFSLPRITLHSAEISGRLRLHDESMTNAVHLDLDFKARARDLATFGEATNMPCSIVVDASQGNASDSCNMLVYVKAAPIQYPLQPTFELTAEMNAVPIPAVAAYFSELGIQDGSLSGALRMTCKEGMLEPKASSLELTFLKPQLSELAQRRLGSFSAPATFRMTLPLAGAFWAPETDVKQAWEQALLSAQNIGAIIDATEKDSVKPDIIKNLFERGHKTNKAP